MTLGLVQADTSNEGKCIRNLLFCVKGFSCGEFPSYLFLKSSGFRSYFLRIS